VGEEEGEGKGREGGGRADEGPVGEKRAVRREGAVTCREFVLPSSPWFRATNRETERAPAEPVCDLWRGTVAPTHRRFLGPHGGCKGHLEYPMAVVHTHEQTDPRWEKKEETSALAGEQEAQGDVIAGHARQALQEACTCRVVVAGQWR